MPLGVHRSHSCLFYSSSYLPQTPPLSGFVQNQALLSLLSHTARPVHFCSDFNQNTQVWLLEWQLHLFYCFAESCSQAWSGLAKWLLPPKDSFVDHQVPNHLLGRATSLENTRMRFIWEICCSQYLSSNWDWYSKCVYRLKGLGVREVGVSLLKAVVKDVKVKGFELKTC